MKHEVSFERSEKGVDVNLPDAITPVAILLMGDIQIDSQPWLALISKVLQGESNYEECTGNNCTLEINKDFTKVIDNYSENEEECIIETHELEKIILLWQTEQSDNH